MSGQLFMYKCTLLFNIQIVLTIAMGYLLGTKQTSFHSTSLLIPLPNSVLCNEF